MRYIQKMEKLAPMFNRIFSDRLSGDKIYESSLVSAELQRDETTL